MDAEAKGGALISITYATGGVPILFIGTGQRYKDISIFDPEEFINQLLNWFEIISTRIISLFLFLIF